MSTQTPQSLAPSTAGGEPSVRDRAGQVGGTARDEAAGVAEEVKHQARDLAGEARAQLRQQVDAQRGRVSDLLGQLGDDLDQMAERDDRGGLAADLARQAATRTREVRRYLDTENPVDDLRQFARRHPGAFLVGALAAGAIVGRTTRASVAARRRSGDRPDTGTDQGMIDLEPGTTPAYYATGAGAAPGYGTTPSTAPPSGYSAASEGIAPAGTIPSGTAPSGTAPLITPEPEERQ